LTVFEAALLGIIQGLTEFLPVSSSGHLALGQALLGIEAGDVTFEIIVHFGTLLAVVTALRERIMVLVRGCLARDSGALRMLGFLILGTIPAAVFGIGLKTTLEEAFASPAVVSGFLIVTGVILWTTRFASGNRKEVTLVDAIIIGCAQACAIFPGISRSGTTIGMGLWRGLDSREVGTFSFLLSIPIILGATILAVDDLLAHPPSGDALWTLIIGAVAAYVSGLFAIRWLMRILAGGKLERFAYYCWIVGILGVGYFWS
jgi:undecaprenyl-diphosphatase